MTVRTVAVLLVASAAWAQPPATLQAPTAFAQPPATLPPPTAFAVGTQKNIVSSPPPRCNSCAGEPFLQVDEGLGNDCLPPRQWWSNVSIFWGKGDDLSVAERKYTYGLDGNAGYWLDRDRTMAVTAGAIIANATYRTVSPGPALVDAPVTLTALDIGGRMHLFEREGIRFDGVAGYQYLQLHERLVAGTPTTYEEIDDRNAINALRVGVVAGYNYGPYFGEVVAAVAVGQNESSVETNGVNVSRTDTCYVPQLAYRSAYQFGEGLWFTVGYRLLYFTDVQRPTLGSGSFFLHGITVGVEKRF